MITKTYREPHEQRYMITLNGEQLSCLRDIVHKLLKGRPVQMADAEKDFQAGKNILKALERPTRLK